MRNQTFYRFSGFLVVAGAIALGVGYLLRPDIEKELIDEFAGGQALASTALVAAGTLVLLCGLPGLFAKQLQRSRMGLFPSGLAFVGIAAFHLGTLALYLVLPVLVRHSDTTRNLIYSDEPPFPYSAIFWAASLLLKSIGFLWLGIILLRSFVYHHFAGVLLIIGAICFVAAPLTFYPLIKTANSCIMLGLIICGIRLIGEQPQFNVTVRRSAAVY